MNKLPTQKNNFDEYLAYHNLDWNNPIFSFIINSPEVLGVNKTFLNDKSSPHRADLICGEYLVKLSEYLGVVGSKLLKRGQWQYELPDWFDHRHHTLNWNDESKNSWTESASLVLRLLPERGNILDLCAGDAYYDYKFFKNMANEITCVDISSSNEYKNFLIKQHAAPNINYVFSDVLEFNPQPNYYNIVWMRSAIEHFTLDNQIRLFQKIKDALVTDGWFCGDTPANPNKDDRKEHVNHENEWRDVSEAKELLSRYFSEVHVYSIYCNVDKRTTIFWQCR